MTYEGRSKFEGWAEGSTATCLLQEETSTVSSSSSTMGNRSETLVLDEGWQPLFGHPAIREDRLFHRRDAATLGVERIFGPLFMAKERGTGLGLSISYAIINEFEEEEQRKRLRAAFDRISDFRHLPQGWDSYTAPQIDQATQVATKKVVKLLWRSLGTSLAEPFVAPCSHGGILLEWELPTTEISVTVGPGGTDFEYLITQKATENIVDEGATRDVGTLVTRILIQFH